MVVMLQIIVNEFLFYDEYTTFQYSQSQLQNLPDISICNYVVSFSLQMRFTVIKHCVYLRIFTYQELISELQKIQCDGKTYDMRRSGYIDAVRLQCVSFFLEPIIQQIFKRSPRKLIDGAVQLALKCSNGTIIDEQENHATLELKITDHKSDMICTMKKKLYLYMTREYISEPQLQKLMYLIQDCRMWYSEI